MIGEFTWIDGVRHRFVYHERGTYVFADGKKQIDGIGFLAVVPA